MSDEWDNLIASLDPVVLERERFRVVGDLSDERPGSRVDHEMRHAHEFLRVDFWQKWRDQYDTERRERRKFTDAEFRRMLDEVAAHAVADELTESASDDLSDAELDELFTAYWAVHRRKAA